LRTSLNRDVENEQLKSSVKEVEDHEAKLNLCQKEHQQNRDKLQQSTLQATLPCVAGLVSPGGERVGRCSLVDDFVHHDLNSESWLQSPETNLASAIEWQRIKSMNISWQFDCWLPKTALSQNPRLVVQDGTGKTNFVLLNLWILSE